MTMVMGLLIPQGRFERIFSLGFQLLVILPAASDLGKCYSMQEVIIASQTPWCNFCEVAIDDGMGLCHDRAVWGSALFLLITLCLHPVNKSKNSIFFFLIKLDSGKIVPMVPVWGDWRIDCLSPEKINATDGYRPPPVFSHCTHIVHSRHGSPTECAEDTRSMNEIIHQANRQGRNGKTEENITQQTKF